MNNDVLPLFNTTLISSVYLYFVTISCSCSFNYWTEICYVPLNSMQLNLGTCVDVSDDLKNVIKVILVSKHHTVEMYRDHGGEGEGV